MLGRALFCFCFFEKKKETAASAAPKKRQKSKNGASVWCVVSLRALAHKNQVLAFLFCTSVVLPAKGCGEHKLDSPYALTTAQLSLIMLTFETLTFETEARMKQTAPNVSRSVFVSHQTDNHNNINKVLKQIMTTSLQVILSEASKPQNCIRDSPVKTGLKFIGIMLICSCCIYKYNYLLTSLLYLPKR